MLFVKLKVIRDINGEVDISCRKRPQSPVIELGPLGFSEFDEMLVDSMKNGQSGAFPIA